LFKRKGIDKILSRRKNVNSIKKCKYAFMKKKFNKFRGNNIITKKSKLLYKYNLNYKNFIAYKQNLIKFNKIKKKIFNLKCKHTNGAKQKRIAYKILNTKFFKSVRSKPIKIDENILNILSINIFALKPFLMLYDFCYLSIIKNKNKNKLKYKAKKFFLKVKKQKKLLLLNIFFNKKKILKPT